MHQEGAIHLNRTIQRIKTLGQRAGVAINPATPAAMLEEILPDLDLVLVMTVNPGFGGQSFLRGTLAKIRTIRRMIDAIGSRCELEVDGGIDPETAPLVVEAGARVLVAGSSIYGSADGVAAAMGRLRLVAVPGKPAGRAAASSPHVKTRRLAGATPAPCHRCQDATLSGRLRRLARRALIRVHRGGFTPGLP